MDLGNPIFSYVGKGEGQQREHDLSNAKGQYNMAIQELSNRNDAIHNLMAEQRVLRRLMGHPDVRLEEVWRRFASAVRRWFEGRFPQGPSPPQASGWPAIARRRSSKSSSWR